MPDNLNNEPITFDQLMPDNLNNESMTFDQLMFYAEHNKLFITGDPDIVFFKVKYRRYKNFAMDCCVPDTNNGQINKNKKRIIRIQITFL
jgi:hypothetical protein